MIEWTQGSNRLLGFDDGDLLYYVYYEEGSGWIYEHAGDMDGMDGHDTAEEAKAAAEKDYAYYESLLDDLELEMTPEEWEEILGDILYEERRDAGLL